MKLLSELSELLIQSSGYKIIFEDDDPILFKIINNENVGEDPVFIDEIFEDEDVIEQLENFIKGNEKTLKHLQEEGEFEELLDILKNLSHHLYTLTN